MQEINEGEGEREGDKREGIRFRHGGRCKLGLRQRHVFKVVRHTHTSTLFSQRSLELHSTGAIISAKVNAIRPLAHRARGF